LNAHIMEEISNLKESVGADKTETSTSTGLYL
jgi:hypothetical protein